MKTPPPKPARASLQHPGSGEKLSCLPWIWIGKRYPSANEEELAALFEAYRTLHSLLDIEEIRTRVPPREEGEACRRCGQCCAELLPDPVSTETITRWISSGNPAHMFHVPLAEGPRAGRFHTGWAFRGTRLRMCPLLHRDPETGNRFCAVYHLGPGHRPPGCEGFRANWPHCEVSQRPLVP